MDPAANRREQLREWAWQSRLSILNLNDSSSSADTGSGNLRAFEWCHACGDASCLARMLGCCLALAVAVSSVSVTSCAGAVLAPNTSQRISRLQHHEHAGEYCRRASSSNQHYIISSTNFNFAEQAARRPAAAVLRRSLLIQTLHRCRKLPQLDYSSNE